jgi:hypothetical protein
MQHRYWMHWYSNSGDPPGAGRRLAGQIAEEALVEAEALWTDGPYKSAIGYIVIDTEDGAVLRRQERDHPGEQGSTVPPATNEAAGHARISAIVERLQAEPAPGQRRLLRRELIEEVDRYGALSRRMDLADAHIHRATHELEILKRVTRHPSRTGNLSGAHGMTVRNWREILDIFTSYRAVLTDGVGRVEL